MAVSFRSMALLTTLAALAACGGGGSKDSGLGTAGSPRVDQPAARAVEPATIDEATAPDGLYGVLHTSLGDIVCRLHYQRVPVAVANFVALAEGGQRWYDEHANEWTTRPLYRDLKFHVIRDLTCQTGDPLGDGSSGPGYTFADEFDSTLTHDGPGVVSMVTHAENTNGSQFQITAKKASWLDNRLTIFGRVVMGQAVVDSMTAVELTGPEHSTPVQDILLKSIDIVRRGAAAQAFDPQSHLGDVNAAVDAKVEFQKSLQADMKRAVKTASGLMYVVTKEGKGPRPSPGDHVVAHYDGYFLDGSKFDSSRDKGVPYTFIVGKGKVIAGWDEAILTMRPGEKRRLIVPPNLAYGEKGLPGFIPPNATLVFDVELISDQPTGK